MQPLEIDLCHITSFPGDSSKLLWISIAQSFSMLVAFHGMDVSQYISPFTS